MKETDLKLSDLDAMMELPAQAEEAIAVIGMAAQIADMDSAEELWQSLCRGECHIRPFPEERREQIADYRRACGAGQRIEDRAYFEHIDRFDAALFRVTPADARRMDPSQRLFAQIAWQALEDGGYGPVSLENSRTGVFVGYSADAHSYARYLQSVDAEEEAKALAGTVNSVIAARISYLLNLRGPALLVDTACSSSLVAVHLACESLRRGECSMALAGGIKLILAPDVQAQGEVSVASSDGITRTFDENSQGTGGGEGVAAVLLKPYEAALADGDHIYAVIKGSAVNQDGRTVGITAPNTQAQQEMLLEAWDRAGIPLESAGYIEAHGTATKLGDSIEIDALTKAMSNYSNENQFCAIGSVKTNVGHLDCAAGIVGLIKAIKVTQTGLIPPSLHFNSPNRQLDFISSPLYVNDRLSTWQGSLPRRVGVSSFGMSGTNCHIVLEEAPSEARYETASPCILTLSALNEAALKRMLKQYISYFETTDALLQDICYTSNVSRGDHKMRAAFLLRRKEDFSSLAHEALLKESCVGCYGGQTEDMLSYLHGQRPDWESMPYAQGAHRVPLPTYPFEQTVYWPSAQAMPKQQPPSDTLLGTLLVNTRDCRVYESRMSVAHTMELREHILGGRHTLAGTVYIEIIRSTMLPLLSSERMELCDLVFLAPLTCGKQEQRVVQTIIVRKEDGWQLSIQSRAADAQEWMPHLETTVLALQAEPNATALSTLQTEFADFRQQEYVANNDDFVHIGPHWNLPIEVFVKDSRVLSHVWVPNDLLPITANYGLYPPLLDGGIHACNVLSGEGFSLPFCFGSLRLYAKTGVHSYGLMEKADSGEGLNTYNGTLYNERGEVVAELRRYSMRKIEQSESAIFGAAKDDAFHRITWVEANEAAQPREREDTLLLCHPSQADHALCACFPSVAVDSEEALLRELSGRNPVKRLIFLHGLREGVGMEDARTLFSLCRFLESNRTWKSELSVVTAKAYSVLAGEQAKPESRLLSAMVQALPLECDRLRVSCIDVDASEQTETLLSALKCQHSHITVSYRDGRCYVPRFEAAQVTREQPTFREDGVYVITGGLGGAGRVIANALSKLRPNIRLVLLTRRSVNELERSELPKQAEVCTCDVSNAEALRACFDRLQRTYGRIHGVFHAAGIAGGGIYLRQNLQSFERTLAPKVAGTRNLYELLKDSSPDFMILFSSYASVLYPMGQADYIAANAYLDAFCTLAPWIKTFNWAGWAETGMAVAHGADQSKNAVRSLTNEEALALLWRSMADSSSQLLLGSLSKTYFEPKLYAPFYLLPTGVKQLEESTQTQQFRLYGKLSGEPTETELHVAQAWATVLELSELDYSAKFLELGGDSIRAAALQKEISRIYHDILDITDVFVYPSIGEMASYIDANRSKRSTSAKPADAQAAPQDDTMELLSKLSSGDIDLEEALAMIGG